MSGGETDQYSGSDLTDSIEDSEEGFRFSEKGRRMAESLAEYLLLRYFFGVEGMRDRKKVDRIAG